MSKIEWNMTCGKIWSLAVFLLLNPCLAQAHQVTRYIVEVQEERKSTRWTLTEWLRIKERMKLMDVWLAMFSKPEKQHFAPEFVMEYANLKGTFHLQPQDSEVDKIEIEEPAGFQGRAQFWLTNLITSTTGVKTLNIDLGIEGGSYRLLQPAEEDYTADLIANQPWTDLSYQSFQTDWWAANFRIFGSNIQDSSLILKYGGYTTKPAAFSGELSTYGGALAGAETYLYFFSWLGAEADYLRFGNTKGAAGSAEQSATMLAYGGFIEIYMLRIGYRLQEFSGSWGSEVDGIYEFRHEGPAWYVRMNF
ncbi:MAG: hypothetical protein ACOH5I_19765 [Oligoflexus sp.]